MTGVQFIDIKKLEPHKDNPRKDLGDLSELAGSIKAQGILQNLTVVPHLGEISGQPTGFYTVIIGHRRMAAAKLAGLETVPCVISEMNEVDQVATMLLENMQRNDLTLLEQANGFQMLIDLGDSVKSISEKTGMSETTIKRRVHLVELDQKKLIKAMERGGTLMDFAELEKIKDPELKSKVLESIGSNNFKWELANALDKESAPERKADLIAEISTFATEISNREEISNPEYCAQFYNFKKDQYNKMPDDIDTEKYYFVVGDNAITLYKERSESPYTAETKMDPKAIAFNKRLTKLRAASETAYKMRYEFVKTFTGAKKYSKQINEFAIKGMLDGLRGGAFETTLEMMNVEIPEESDYRLAKNMVANLILEEYKAAPEYVMLASVYNSLDREADYFYARSWECTIDYRENEILDTVYDALVSLGYEMSDEEKQLQDGTHVLFTKDEKEKADE